MAFTRDGTNYGNNAQEVVSAENAYQKFLTAMAELTENNVPVAGRVAFVTPTYYSLLKQSGTFISAGDMAQEMLIKGQVGMVDGAAIVVVSFPLFTSRNCLFDCSS